MTALARDVKINQFQLFGFQKIAADISDEVMFQPGAGHGHPPAWIMGHLAIVAEMGHQALGGDFTHPEWIEPFAPGSKGQVSPTEDLSKSILLDAIVTNYTKLQEMALAATEEHLARPNGVKLFENTPIQDVGDVIALLLTNHFGFHQAQLSSCRREAGFPAIF